MDRSSAEKKGISIAYKFTYGNVGTGGEGILTLPCFFYSCDSIFQGCRRSARKALRLFLQRGFFLSHGLEYETVGPGMTCGVNIDIGDKALEAC